MKITLISLLNTLFPVREDARIVQNASEEVLTKTCTYKDVGGITALLPFSDQSVRACIHEVKFHKNEKAADLLGMVFATYIHREDFVDTLFVPIPLSTKRHRERGYNQVTYVLQYAKRHNPNIATHEILIRTKHTAPQTSLRRRERKHNLENAFALKNPEHAASLIGERHVVLVDDVVTTGATLRAARAALAPHAKHLTCLALAH